MIFYRYITPNDTGSTGSHQSGFYVGKSGSEFLFDSPGIKGHNMDKLVVIDWLGYGETKSRFIYYGKGTRDEYRITRFGRGFPYLKPEYEGSLLVVERLSAEHYKARVIQSSEEIEEWFDEHNVSPGTSNEVIGASGNAKGDRTLRAKEYQGFLQSLRKEYPSTSEMSTAAQRIHERLYGKVKGAADPDTLILEWLQIEYELFQFIEADRLSEVVQSPLGSVDNLLAVAQTCLQRRKSRAGKSLENHLESILRAAGLRFQPQGQTEHGKTTDFLFPGSDAYQSRTYDKSKLMLLAAKTTAKDRWRQVADEAKKIQVKHLFTLQEGISSSQVTQMIHAGIQLVVPRSKQKTYDKSIVKYLMTLEQFIELAKNTYSD